MSGLDDGSSPWENGDVPVRDAPLEVTWDAPSRPPAPDSDTDGTTTSTAPRWAIGAVAATVLVLVALVAWPRGSDGDDAGSTPVTLDSLPSVSDPDEEGEDDDTDEEFDADGNGSASGGVATESNSSAIDGELPAGVAAITAPTEIVVRSTDGRIHTVSLPSGNIRTVDLGFTGSSGGNLVVSNDATMIGEYDRGTFIVPREGVPMRLDGVPFDQEDEFGNSRSSPYGYVTAPDGTQSFIVAAFEPGRNDRRSDYLVDADGVVTPVPDGVVSEFSDPVRAYGTRIVNDAGGVYRLDDDVAARISDGQAIGSSPTELLIRDCDAALLCTFSVVDFDGENEREVALPPGLGRTYGLELAPDASAVTFNSYGTQNEQVIIEFSGDSSSTPVAGFGGAAWASDGSGVFSLAPEGGLLFVNRATGEGEVFAEELGQLTAIDIRFPDSELDTAPAVSEVDISLSATPAGDIGIDIAILSEIGAMSILDLDQLTSVSWTAPRITGSNTPRIFDLGDRLVVLAGAGNSGFTTVPGDPTPIDDDALPEPPFALGPDGSGIWTRSPDVLPDIGQVVDLLREIEGYKPPVVTAPDGDVLGDDGAGSLVIESGGDVYTADGDDTIRLTTGDLIAVSPAAALVRECDEPLVCSEFLVDRANGERSQLISLATVAIAVDEGRDVSLVGSLSPNAGTMLIETPLFDADGEPTTGWMFVDVGDGTQTPVATPDDDQPIIWNDDGTYAVFLADGRLSLYEASTHTIIDVELTSGTRAIGRVDGELVSPRS